MLSQPHMPQKAENHYIVPQNLSADQCRKSFGRALEEMSEGASLFFALGLQTSCQQLLILTTAALRRRRNNCMGQSYERTLRHRYANERLPGTCRWLFQEQAYCKWKLGHEPACMMIDGQPGTGKTMLCLSIVEDLLKTEHQTEIAYLFVSYEDFRGLDTALYVLDCLICQLVRKGRRTAPWSQVLSIQKSLDMLECPVSEDLFHQYLIMILGTLEPQARLIVALDGLQKDEWITNAILYEIFEANILRDRSNHIRCVVTSILPRSAILHRDQIVSIDMSSQIGVQHDIYLFAKARLALYPQPRTEDTVFVDSMARKLCLRANGCFLWVQMVTECQNGSGQLEKALENLDSVPSSLQGLYAALLQTVPRWRTSIVQSIFSWLLAAVRPLKLGELLEALIIELDWHRTSGNDAYAVERLGLQNPKIDIPQICGGLVRIFPPRVFLFGIAIEFAGHVSGWATFLLLRPLLHSAVPRRTSNVDSEVGHG